jgi:Tfp pilus assembly protein PilF
MILTPLSKSQRKRIPGLSKNILGFCFRSTIFMIATAASETGSQATQETITMKKFTFTLLVVCLLIFNSCADDTNSSDVSDADDVTNPAATVDNQIEPLEFDDGDESESSDSISIRYGTTGYMENGDSFFIQINRINFTDDGMALEVIEKSQDYTGPWYYSHDVLESSYLTDKSGNRIAPEIAECEGWPDGETGPGNIRQGTIVFKGNFEETYRDLTLHFAFYPPDEGYGFVSIPLYVEPEAEPEPPDIDEDDYVGWGYYYLEEEGQFNMAIRNFDAALNVDPENTRALAGRGLAQTLRGYPDVGIADANKALDIDPNFADAHNVIGAAYVIMGKNEEAIDEFTRAISLDRGFEDAYYNRGKTYMDMGNYHAAISNFSSAISIDPGDATNWYMRGRAYQADGNPIKASEDFLKAIDLDPEYKDIIGL